MKRNTSIMLAASMLVFACDDSTGDGDADVDGDVDSDTDVDVDSDIDVDSDGDTDADGDSDGDSVSDGGEDADRGSDADQAGDADVAASFSCGWRTCDHGSEVCVANEGHHTEYECAPRPAGCTDAVTCECAGDTLCTGAFDQCSDDDPSDEQITCR